MITLTTPTAIPTVLGSGATVNFDQCVITRLTFDVLTKDVTGHVILRASSDPALGDLEGQLEVRANALTLTFARLDFQRRIALSGAQQTALSGIITDAQTALEAGLISLGTVSGVQTPGA